MSLLYAHESSGLLGRIARWFLLNLVYYAAGLVVFGMAFLLAATIYAYLPTTGKRIEPSPAVQQGPSLIPPSGPAPIQREQPPPFRAKEMHIANLRPSDLQGQFIFVDGKASAVVDAVVTDTGGSVSEVIVSSPIPWRLLTGRSRYLGLSASYFKIEKQSNQPLRITTTIEALQNAVPYVFDAESRTWHPVKTN